MRYRINRKTYPTKEQAIAAATDTVMSCGHDVTIHIDHVVVGSPLTPILERALAGASVDDEIRAYLQTREAWRESDLFIDVKIKNGAVIVTEHEIPF